MILPPRGVVVSARTGRGRILIVDDEESLVRLFSRVLVAAGYEVSTRPDGQAAVELQPLRLLKTA